MRKNINTKTLFVAVLLITYLAILMKFMVSTHHVPSDRVLDVMPSNFMPFKTILPYLRGYPTWIVARNNLLGNIILLMPLGFLLPLLYRPISWKGVLGIAAALSLGIETLQLVLRAGAFDVDDLLLNTLGAVLGYGALIAIIRVAKACRIRYSGKMKKVWLIAVTAAAVLVCAFAVWKLYPSSGAPTIDDGTSGNYGLFIDNLDSGYFSTTDANVKRIVQAYLTNPDAKTDSDKYGYSLVFYYNKDVFIAEGLFSPTDRNSVSSFVIHDMQTGKPMFDCYIYAQAGLYKDNDLLLSASFTNNGVDMKQGVCLYERGAPNFTFIDLTPKLAANEMLFNDPAGRNLHANIKNVDTQKKTFTVDVYDTTKKDSDGNYAYKRSVEVSY